MSWRAFAATLLLLGVAGGARVAMLPTRRVAMGAGLAGLSTLAFIHVGTLLARRERRSQAVAEVRAELGTTASITVLVAARDEVLAIAGLIGDLGRQTCRTSEGAPAFDVVIVDDRSTDGTGDAARRAADEAGLLGVTTVVRRGPGAVPDGKGAALASIPDHLIRGDAVVILDADARLEPDVLRRATALLGQGWTMFTMRRRVAGSERSSVVQDDEQTVDAFVQRARAALGGNVEFRGNGMVIRTDVLSAVGGWGAGVLTEDLDLSTRLAIRGSAVRLAVDLDVWEAPTATVPAFARQRLRWAEGSTRRFLAHLPTAVSASGLSTSAKLDLVASFAELVFPTAILGAIAEGLRRGRPGPGLALVGSYLATVGALTMMALRDPDLRGSGPRPTTRRIALTAIYLGHWLMVPPAALLSVTVRVGPLRFARTRDRRLPVT